MKRIAIITLLMTSCLQLSACGVEIVDAGETGIKKTLGKVSEETLPPGFYTYNPFLSSVYTLTTKTQKMEDTTEVYTKDVQQVQVTFAINYALQSGSAVKIYTTVGEGYEDTLIPQVINGSMKNIIGKWDAIELVANRSKASQDIEHMIASELAKDGFLVSGFQLTNIKFQPQFEKAVEDKVSAVQKAEQAKNETVQVQEQAKQRLISAQAEAEAMQVQTAALKESQSLVMYEAVKRWDGHLPKIVSSGAGSIFQIPADGMKDAINK